MNEVLLKREIQHEHFEPEQMSFLYMKCPSQTKKHTNKRSTYFLELFSKSTIKNINITFDSLIEPLLSSPVHRYYRVYIYKKRKIWINLVLNVFWFWCENRIGFPILIEYFRKSAHHLKANLTKERHKFKIIWIYVN